MKMKSLVKASVTAAMLAATVSAFAGNLQIEKQVTVNASAATVWKMVGDFNNLDVWHPVVVGSKVIKGTDNMKGALRLLTLGNGATITEQLLSRSDDSKSYNYAIKISPLPVQNYVSEIKVTPAKDGMSIVSWSSTFDAKNASDEDAKAAIAGIYDAGLNNIKKDFAK